jgi:predicted negative regulator of RcsB-dependent stress response
MLEKIKEFIKEHWEEIILVIGVILISLLSFAIGYITAKHEEKEPIKIENSKFEILISKQIQNSNSSNSKYYFVWNIGICNLEFVSNFEFRI